MRFFVFIWVSYFLIVIVCGASTGGKRAISFAVTATNITTHIALKMFLTFFIVYP